MVENMKECDEDEIAIDALMLLGLDVNISLGRLSGRKDIYLTFVKRFYEKLPELNKQAGKSVKHKDINNFRIHIHSIKSSLATIGATELSTQALVMEKAAKDEDFAFCEAQYPSYSQSLLELYEQLAEVFHRKIVGRRKKEKVHGHDKAKKDIIVVDDNTANLITCNKILKDIYNVHAASSAEKMFEVLKTITPSLILLDVEMPGIHGYEAIRILKGEEKYKDLPIIFLSAMDDAQTEMEGLNLGAVDYIHKPFVSSLLIKRIETHIAIIEGKKEMLAFNNEIDSLLARKTNNKDWDKTEILADLLKRSEFTAEMSHRLRDSLNTIIDLIETAIKTKNNEIKDHCLGSADIETRLMMEILDDILDIQ
ncbi:MAG: response regulator [Lachnospiraceae bacterium]|nr:response regulator [Lachnospiraceae bacterium]